jgi:uncharacterized protein YndB with AHSA1/START domain
MTARNDVAEEVVISRTYDAPKKLVFEAWSSGERLARWWGPYGFSAPECEVDFKSGGKLAIRMTGHGMDHWMRGQFDEIVEGERIAFTVRVDGLDQDIRATVTFEEAGGKTTMTVRQTVPRNSMMARGQQQGWTEQMEKLAKLL